MELLNRSELSSVHGGRPLGKFVIVDANGKIQGTSDSAKELVDALKDKGLLGPDYHVMATQGYLNSQG